MLRVTGSSKIVICDIEARRVDFATANEFADLGFVVPKKRGVSIEEKLDIAKETAGLAMMATGEGDGFGGFDAVFECTGVEACVQTAIYVCASCFISNIQFESLTRANRQIDLGGK